jgi:glycosyltransferase involved in cell wall biosynthesis
MLWNADSLVFVSDATRRASLPRGRRRRTTVIHNGVDLERFRPATARDPGLRERLGLPGDVPVVAQVGSLIERKGVATLLAAFARVCARRPACLVLAGDGPDRADFELLAGRLGVADRVRFLGEWSAPETLWRDLVDVNVLASRQEALPLSLIEASACGVASVCSDVGGSGEVVADGETGLLFPSGDDAALASRLEQLLADDALRLRFGAAARRRAETAFGVGRYVRDVETEMATLIAGA